MDFSDYQRAANETNQYKQGSPHSVIPPLFGLASEAGQILNVYKNYLRDGLDVSSSKDFLKEELGDLIWYVTAVATAVGLDLQEIIETNLRRTHDRYQAKVAGSADGGVKVLDASYPESERFPRQMVLEFADRPLPSGQLAASVTLVSANPNAFPNGPLVINGKECGYRVGETLGAELTDNSRLTDAYRFHDAIHMGFMAVLGWSPTMRALLKLKRRSRSDVDECEDGARAVYAEEGLAAVLSRLASRRGGFQTTVSVDGDALVVATAASTGLEVSSQPTWLWRQAISQGFLAMQQLGANHGGYLVVDLDERTLTYKKVL